MAKLTAILDWVSPVESITGARGTFQFRKVWATDHSNARYPNYLEFQFSGKALDEPAMLTPGIQVEIEYDIAGRSWTKDGREGRAMNLNAWSIRPLGMQQPVSYPGQHPAQQYAPAPQPYAAGYPGQPNPAAGPGYGQYPNGYAQPNTGINQPSVATGTGYTQSNTSTVPGSGAPTSNNANYIPGIPQGAGAPPVPGNTVPAGSVKAIVNGQYLIAGAPGQADYWSPTPPAGMQQPNAQPVQGQMNFQQQPVAQQQPQYQQSGAAMTGANAVDDLPF